MNEASHMPQPEAFQPPAPKYRISMVDQLEFSEPEFLVDGLLETQCLSMIFGDPGCGKSFLALDIALCVATGTTFHTRPVMQGPVIYLAGEGHNGLMRRIKAWSKDRNVDLTGKPMFLSHSAPQFLVDNLVVDVAMAVERIKEQHGPPSLIVVDTVARSFAGGDENSTPDMTKYVAALDAFRERYKCTILLVHHTGHAEKRRARGNMALKGALDAEYRVEKDKYTISVDCTKMKDAEEPEPLHFALKEVTLGFDRKRKPIGSATLQATTKFTTDEAQKLTDGDIYALNAYEQAVIEFGELDEEGKFTGIHRDDWKTTFYRGHTADKDETKRKAFSRARQKFVDDKRMKVVDDVYSPVGVHAAFDIPRYETLIKRRDMGQ